MERTSKFITALSLFFISAISYAQELMPIVVPADCLRVIELVNQERARYGLPRLVEDKELCRRCESWSIIQSNYNGLSHCPNFRRYATCECIAGNVYSPESVVTLWIRKCGRGAFLTPGLFIGVGVSGGYWTLRIR